MPRYKHKNRFIRYLKVHWRAAKRMRLATIRRWFRKNIKGHPFVTGILFFYWTSTLLKHAVVYKMKFRGFYKLSLIILVSWFILVWLGNLLRDRNVRWYYRKKFVLLLLTLYAPIGIIFLWAGSKFKRITKIILTVVFSLMFIFYFIYMNKRYDALFNKSTLMVISDLIEKSQRKTYLKKAPAHLLSYLQEKFETEKFMIKLTPAQIAKNYSKCVVSIKTSDCAGRKIGQASGFIATDNGIIVTNFHVIDGAYSAQINFNGRIFQEAGLIKGIPNLDIAILKIDAVALPELPLGDSNKVVSGQAVVAISNPLGLERSISNGIISAIRTVGNIRLIQMTAPVSMGSSGGPIINEYGQAIGIATVASIWGAQNVNFAVPINYIKSIVEEVTLH